ncbi:MAG TPA: ATP-binding protein [Opitutaceae bacterium]|jgi:DNA transposition AAA+ family ATPase|nr:ATP-binding protein [Opitutaceae bacterium]
MTTTATDHSTPQARPQAEPAGGNGDNIRSSWNVSLDSLQMNVSHCSDEAKDLIQWCFLWCIDEAHPIRLEEFALRIDVDKTTIQRIIKGLYFKPGQERIRMGISDAIVGAMRLFRQVETERAKSGRTVFILTPTAKRIHTACHLARESQSPVFLIGPSHVGKTWALKNYTEENNHGRTIYVRLAAASGLGGMVRVIAEALGISDRSNTAALIARIKRALKPDMLLILDELHQLMYTYRKEAFFACLEVIREFYDIAGCGFVLCGTELLMKSMKDNRGELEQLLRRGVHRVVLPDMPTRGDVSAILEASLLSLPDKALVVQVRIGSETISDRPYEILKQIGKEQGLKAITERLRYAQKFAKKAQTKLTWEHFVRAHLTIKQNSIAESDWS